MPEPDPKSQLSGEAAQRFMRLFAAHQRRLFGYVFALVRDETDADDVLQEALGVMWAKFGELAPEADAADFGAWATRIARFKALELFAQRRRSHALFSPATMQAIADRMDALGDRSERVHDALSACLTKLPDADRTLVEARYRDDVHADELAARFSRSRSQIYRTLNRIYGLLLVCIERTLDGAGPAAGEATR